MNGETVRPIIEFNTKPIKDFDGYYVSVDGKIYSTIGRGCRDKSKSIAPHEIKPRLARNGYTRVYCRRTSTNKREDLYIHRVVAEHYIPNLLGKPNVNHINCKRDDNNAFNLEWVTTKENNEYAMQVGNVSRDNTTGRFISGIIDN